jgi:hypothetical protein
MFVLACLVIFLIERSVNRALYETVRVEEPTRAASYEMEISVAEMARDVLDYQNTGDARYLEQFEDNKGDFERFKGRYDALVDTERGEEHGDRIEVPFEEYAALGEDLVGSEPSGARGGALGTDERRFLELQDELDLVFDEEVQPWTARQLEESGRAAEGAIRSVYLALAFLLLGGCSWAFWRFTSSTGGSSAPFAGCGRARSGSAGAVWTTGSSSTQRTS